MAPEVEERFRRIESILASLAESIQADRQAHAEALEKARQAQAEALENERRARTEALEQALEKARQAQAEALESERRARAEAHVRHELDMAEARQQNAETRAIANSNARAIEALGDKLSDLIRIVGEFAQATNNRLAMIEDRLEQLDDSENE